MSSQPDGQEGTPDGPEDRLVDLMRNIDPDVERDELEWDEQGRWWVGKVNTFAAVTRSHNPPNFVTVMDSTLREGEEVPGTALDGKTKIRLAHAIAAAGFREIEVGYAGVIDEHEQLVRDLKAEQLPVKIASHTRIYGQDHEWQDEIDRNLDCGVEILTFVGFASEVGTATTPWLRKEQVPERVTDCCEYAKRQGALVTFGLADMVRTKLDYIVHCYRAAVQAGADRLYVYDGLGAATPDAVSYLTLLLRDIAGEHPEIGVHIHNTFGMATACAISAVTAGASVVDAVPLGLGDGAGITASEEVVAALRVLYDLDTGVELSHLKPLCETVADAFGMEIPATKALVGVNQYRHSIDSHVAAILRGAWHSWEIIRPDVLGQDRELQFGYSKLRRGRSGALFAKAQQLGFDPTQEQMDEILESVRELTLAKDVATEQDVETIIQRALMAGGGESRQLKRSPND